MHCTRSQIVSAERYTAVTIVRHLKFHVATLALTCAFIIIMAVSGSLYLLGCLFARSFQYAQYLTKVFWKMELAIYTLVANEDELVPVTRRRRSILRAEQDAPKQKLPKHEEVTLAVMLYSLLYFLVFKGILGILLSALPLTLWAICLVQCLPSYTRLSVLKLVPKGSLPTQVLTAVTFAFFAHQVSVMSARGLLFISRNAVEFVFSRNEMKETRDQVPTATESKAQKRIGLAVSKIDEKIHGKHACLRHKTGGALSFKTELLVKGVKQTLHQGYQRDSASYAARPKQLSDVKQQQALENWLQWLDKQSTYTNIPRDTGQHGMRRCTSFDNGDSNLALKPTTLSDAEDEITEKGGAHKSTFKASSLKLSTPTLSPRNLRRRSFDALREQKYHGNYCLYSLRKCWSEPVFSSYQNEKMYASDSKQDSRGVGFVTNQQTDDMKRLLRDRQRSLQRPIWRNNERLDDFSIGGTQYAAGIYTEVKECKTRNENVEWHQKRNERKMQKYEQKLLAARLRIDKQNDRRMEKYIEVRRQDRYAIDVEHAVGKTFYAPKTQQNNNQRCLQSFKDTNAGCPRYATQTAPSNSPAAPAYSIASMGDGFRKRTLSSRPSTISDHKISLSSRNHVPQDRLGSDTQTSPAGSLHDISDFNIHHQCENTPEENDMHKLHAYLPLSHTSSSLEYTTALYPSPIYQNSSEYPDYDNLSLLDSPRSRRSSPEVNRDYDLLSPIRNNYDAEFSTDKFQQVYRSIQMAAVPEVCQNASPIAVEEGGLDAKPTLTGVSGRRDRVNFSAFAPPSVCPSPKPFQFTVWAFLLNQRFEMQELAQGDHPASRKLSLKSKLNVRRGALVHVTLEAPSGFEVQNGATQGFAWEGYISSVDFDVVCTDGAAFGRVLFKARIAVGSSVAVLNSFVLVGSRVVDPSELEADVLEGWMDVMEQTYREIPFQSLDIKELVGKGYFGDAYRALLDGEDVVVKTIRASEFGETTSQIVREFQHEAAMLSMFGHHPCIVPFVGASTDTNFPLALVTKYLPYGNLEDNLRAGPSLSIDERTGMLKDAAAGLLNIHEGGFIHRDLAARNCLVDQGKHVRICDFGLCRRVRSETAGMLMKDAVGPVKYMAPESLQPPHAFSYDSDVYMFGVLMWETFTNLPPFASLTPVEAMIHVLRGERLPVPKELPVPLQTLMQDCFHDSPAERPSMQQVLTTLSDSLISSERLSVAITARNGIASVTNASAVSTTMSKSVAKSRKEQDRTIWV